MTPPKLGKQPPRYKFFLNPYVDARFTRCPLCEAKTRQKKLPLVIHIDDWGMIVLNKTCRFCPGCDLLIAHQDQLEANLATFFDTHKPDVVGSDYLVVGTVDRPDWKRGHGDARHGARHDRAPARLPGSATFRDGWGLDAAGMMGSNGSKRSLSLRKRPKRGRD